MTCRGRCGSAVVGRCRAGRRTAAWWGRRPVRRPGGTGCGRASRRRTRRRRPGHRWRTATRRVPHPAQGRPGNGEVGAFGGQVRSSRCRSVSSWVSRSVAGTLTSYRVTCCSLAFPDADGRVRRGDVRCGALTAAVKRPATLRSPTRRIQRITDATTLTRRGVTRSGGAGRSRPAPPGLLTPRPPRRDRLGFQEVAVSGPVGRPDFQETESINGRRDLGRQGQRGCRMSGAGQGQGRGRGSRSAHVAVAGRGSRSRWARVAASRGACRGRGAWVAVGAGRGRRSRSWVAWAWSAASAAQVVEVATWDAQRVEPAGREEVRSTVRRDTDPPSRRGG